VRLGQIRKFGALVIFDDGRPCRNVEKEYRHQPPVAETASWKHVLAWWKTA
jgi:hypothetical protein